MCRSISIILLAASFAPAQSNPAKLVRLTAVAVDKQERPVRDLMSTDFKVFDNGKPQTIVFFRRGVGHNAQPAPLAPNEFSNRSEGQRHTVVVLLDLLNNRFGARNYGANEITRALEDSESNADVYLYMLTLNGSLFPVVALPASGPRLGPPSEESNVSIQKSVDDAMRAVNRLRPLGVWINQQIDETYAAITTLALQMARFPGRKSLVWVTHGVPIEIRLEGGSYFDYTPSIAKFCDSLKNMGIAVYPNAISDQNLTRSDPSMQTLDLIAGLTGGEVMARDVPGSVKQASRDEDANYTLQYYPSQEKRDGKYHKVRVACSRSGVRILSEQGYYADPKTPPKANAMAPDASDVARQAAILSPYDDTAIPIQAKMVRTSNPPQSMHFDLQIDVSNLLPVDGSSETYQGQFTVTSAEYESGGEPLVSSPATVNFGGRKSQAPYSGDLQLGPKIYSVRFIVLDPKTGAVGSLTIPAKAIQ